VTRVGSIFYWSGLSGQPSLVWVRKISPKNPNFSIFFPSCQKNLGGLGQKVLRSKRGWPLIYCRLKVCSGCVRAHLNLQATFDPRLSKKHQKFSQPLYAFNEINISKAYFKKIFFKCLPFLGSLTLNPQGYLFLNLKHHTKARDRVI